MRLRVRLTPSREMDLPLVLLLRDSMSLLVRQTSTDGSGLLVSKVER